MNTNPPPDPPANKPEHTEAEARRLIALLNDDDAAFEDKCDAIRTLLDWGWPAPVHPGSGTIIYRKG